MKKIIMLSAVFILFSMIVAAAERPEWNAYSFLVGKWEGVGSGKPGEGTGAMDFSFDLNENVLIRRAVADYPAAGGKPAYHHEDLTIIHLPDKSGASLAVYFDNEGHTIQYTATASPDGKQLVFVSPESTAPRYRLTYTQKGLHEVSVRFEISGTGKDADFKTYVEGVSRKK